MSWYLINVSFPLWHVFPTIWYFTDMCFSVQFVILESRGMLYFSWIQYSLPWRICFFLNHSWNEWKYVWSWYLSTCVPLISSILFSYFLIMSRIFFSIFVNLSLICLCLSSPTSFIFTMDEFIPCNCAPTESEIFWKTFQSFRRFFLWSFECVDYFFFQEQRLHLVSSVCLRSLQSTSFFCLYLLLIPVCPLTRSYPFLPVFSETSQS